MKILSSLNPIGRFAPSVHPQRGDLANRPAPCLPVLLLLVLFLLAACGPFELSVEGTATSAAETPAPAESAAPTRDSGPTVAALQTENARLAVQVATLAAAQAAPPGPQPSATRPAPAPATTVPPTPLPSTPAPTMPAPPTPVPPTLAPAGPAVRITFPPGSASITVSPNLVAGQAQSYVLKINAGQHIILTADHELQASVRGPDNRPLVPSSTAPRQWDFLVTQTGDQTIVLAGVGRATVTIYVPPR